MDPNVKRALDRAAESINNIEREATALRALRAIAMCVFAVAVAIALQKPTVQGRTLPEGMDPSL